MSDDLNKSLEKQAKKYFTLSDENRLKFLDETYTKKNLSFDVIAKYCGTYKNKVIRDAKKLGLKIKTKAEAQKHALASGRQAHPTEGKEIPLDVKQKISKTIVTNLTPADRKKRSQNAKKRWDKMGYIKQEQFKTKGKKAIRTSSEDGSKLEIYLRDQLKKHIKEFGQVIYHQQHLMYGTKMHLDILLPALKTVVEIDGISHKENVWGDKSFNASRKSDRKKDGLLLGKGYVMIRVDHPKRVPLCVQTSLWEQLYEALTQIKDKFPKEGERLIKIASKIGE